MQLRVHASRGDAAERHRLRGIGHAHFRDDGGRQHHERHLSRRHRPRHNFVTRQR